MNIFYAVKAAREAMRYGAIVAHPVRWKSAQALSMILVAIAVPLYSAFCSSPDACYGVGQDDVANIATWLGGAAFALFQVWATVSTTTKIGIGKKDAHGGPVGHDSVRKPDGPPRASQLPPDVVRHSASPRPTDPSIKSPDDPFGNFRVD